MRKSTGKNKVIVKKILNCLLIHSKAVAIIDEHSLTNIIYILLADAYVYRMMHKLRIGLVVIAAVVIIVLLTAVDYNNLSWSNNSRGYGGIILMMVIITGMIYSNWHEKNKKS